MEYLGTDKTINNVKPLATVCITTYQHAGYIEKCLQSILDQETNFSFEIVIGEDESSDGTREICKEYAEKYPNKIRLFLRSRKNVRFINGNPTGRYNFIETLKEARGQYIAYCDGDDYWIDPKKLQTQISYMETNSEISMSLHNAYTVDENGSKISIFPDVQEQKIIPAEKIIEKGGGYCATNSIIFRSNILENMPGWFVASHVGDYSVYLLAIHKGKIGALPQIMSCYRTGHANSWSDLRNQAKNIDNNLESLKNLLFTFNRYSNFQYEKSIKTRIALEEIYSAVKIIKSGRLHYLKKITINDFQYILPAFIKILKRKLGLKPF